MGAVCEGAHARLLRSARRTRQRSPSCDQSAFSGEREGCGMLVRGAQKSEVDGADAGMVSSFLACLSQSVRAGQDKAKIVTAGLGSLRNFVERLASELCSKLSDRLQGSIAYPCTRPRPSPKQATWSCEIEVNLSQVSQHLHSFRLRLTQRRRE
jgi:hypothetical protein